MANEILNDCDPKGKSFLNDESPKICVVCAESYSEGLIHEIWIDATLPVEDIRAQIKDMLSNSPFSDYRTRVKRFLIHDSKGFGCLILGKYESIESVHDKAMFILQRGELGAHLLFHLGNVRDAHEALTHHYYGKYDCPLSFAVEFFDDNHLSQIPEEVQAYIDYGAFRDDIFRDDFFALEVDGNTHVFGRGKFFCKAEGE